MSQIIQLNSLIDSSGLAQEDKEIWKKHTASVPDLFIENLIYFFEQMPQLVPWLNKNFKEKIEVIQTGDKQRWQDFLAKEKQELQAIIEEQAKI